MCYNRAMEREQNKPEEIRICQSRKKAASAAVRIMQILILAVPSAMLMFSRPYVQSVWKITLAVVDVLLIILLLARHGKAKASAQEKLLLLATEEGITKYSGPGPAHVAWEEIEEIRVGVTHPGMVEYPELVLRSSGKKALRRRTVPLNTNLSTCSARQVVETLKDFGRKTGKLSC